MVSTKSILALVVAIGVALAVTFAIDNFVLKKEFDVTKTIIDIIVVSVVLFVGSMVASKVVGSKGVTPPKAQI